MGQLLTRAADRMLARLAPRVTAAAACWIVTRYCYCSRGVAYRELCKVCDNNDLEICYSCQPSGTC